MVIAGGANAILIRSYWDIVAWNVIGSIVLLMPVLCLAYAFIRRKSLTDRQNDVVRIVAWLSVIGWTLGMRVWFMPVALWLVFIPLAILYHKSLWNKGCKPSPRYLTEGEGIYILAIVFHLVVGAWEYTPDKWRPHMDGYMIYGSRGDQYTVHRGMLYCPIRVNDSILIGHDLNRDTLGQPIIELNVRCNHWK